MRLLLHLLLMPVPVILKLLLVVIMRVLALWAPTHRGGNAVCQEAADAEATDGRPNALYRAAKLEPRWCTEAERGGRARRRAQRSGESKERRAEAEGRQTAGVPQLGVAPQ